MKSMLWNEAQKFIDKTNDIIYLWFGTQWCGDCQMMLPIVEKIEEKFCNEKQIHFIKVDAEEAKLFRKDTKWKVLRVPAHVFIKNKQIKSILYEYIPEEILINEIDKLRYEK